MQAERRSSHCIPVLCPLRQVGLWAAGQGSWLGNGYLWATGKVSHLQITHSQKEKDTWLSCHALPTSGATVTLLRLRLASTLLDASEPLKQRRLEALLTPSQFENSRVVLKSGREKQRHLETMTPVFAYRLDPIVSFPDWTCAYHAQWFRPVRVGPGVVDSGCLSKSREGASNR